MKNLKNQKGITLVALVITIIVLLILAGVALSLVAGNEGILTKAVTAVDETEYSSAKEQAELAIAETVADYYEAKYVNRDTTVEADINKYVADNITKNAPTDYNLSISGINVTVSRKNGNTTLWTGTLSNGKVNSWTRASV